MPCFVRHRPVFKCQLQIEEILEKESIDLVVLARYMQILTKDFCDKHWKHTINIHHRLGQVNHRAEERRQRPLQAGSMFWCRILQRRCLP